MGSPVSDAHWPPGANSPLASSEKEMLRVFPRAMIGLPEESRMKPRNGATISAWWPSAERAMRVMPLYVGPLSDTKVMLAELSGGGSRFVPMVGLSNQTHSV